MNLLKWITPPETKREGPPNTRPEPPPAPPRPRQQIAISLADMTEMAKSVAQSGMFGVKSEAQALSLMLLCHAEGLHPILALRRYHIIENKPSMRADALQGEFEQLGAILWHERTETECSATFFRDKRQATPTALNRARERYATLKAGQPTAELSELGEMTIIRTMADAIDKKVAMAWDKDRQEWKLKHNWKQSPRQMLHARCLSEGVRAIAPGLIAGIYTEDEALDFPDDGPEPMTAQDRVTQATENRTRPVEAEIIEPVTEDNYNKVVCHIGKAEGPMLGKKVSEIPLNVLAWLKNHYGDGEDVRWGNPPTAKDERLKAAVDLALKKME